jgi:hypothetical protein
MRPRQTHTLSPNNQQDELHQHRNKRQQFQPPITTFFAYRDLDSDDSDLEEQYERGPELIARSSLHKHHNQHPPRDSLVPSVPHHIQADLLSVGMRVRKSVPEGYKTHNNSNNKTVALPIIQTTLLITGNGSSTTTTTTMTATQYSMKPPQDAVPDDYQHQRELLPFSGLQKHGGFAEQPTTNVHLYAGTSASGERALNFFPLPAEAFTQPFSSSSSSSSSSSHSSTDSFSSLRPNPTNPYKRSWQDEENANNPLKITSEFFFKIPVKVSSEDEVPVSPLSASPPPNSIHSLPPSLQTSATLRPVAQPKTRRPGGGGASSTRTMMDLDGIMANEAAAAAAADVDMDYCENYAAEKRVRVRLGGPGDFDEAEFLHPWGAAGREVAMGGV